MTGYRLTLLDKGPKAIRGRARFTADFPGFDGHFPDVAGGKILPGFWHVQIALDLVNLARPSAAPLHLLGELHAAKFLSPIRPNDPIDIEIVSNAGTWAATLHAKDAEYAAVPATNSRAYSHFRMILA